MSIEKIKKLEELKSEAAKLNKEWNDKILYQRPIAVKSLLSEMAEYLESHNFAIDFFQGADRGFTASYGGTKVKVSSSKDDETFVGADYMITLESGKKSAQVGMRINKGELIHPPHGNDTDAKIRDYETRYIPALQDSDLGELDGKYTVTINHPGLRIPLRVANGKEALDKFFEHLA